MSYSDNLGITILKATITSTVFFWMFIIHDSFNVEMIPFIFISVIPIFILCSLAICVTIMPFIWSEKEGRKRDEIFKKYFPFYAVGIFLVFSYPIISSEFQEYVIAFFMTSFLILMQSWIWLCKPNKLVS